MKSGAADYLLPDPTPAASRLRHLEPLADRPKSAALPGDGRRRWAAGMRAMILDKLHELSTATVAELAAALGFSPGAIGPRLTELAELGQVRSWRVQPRGPGQPKKVWTRTP